jgi:hypothetical protein
MKMSDIIKDPILVSAIQDLARGIKSEADLSSLTRELLRIAQEGIKPQCRFTALLLPSSSLMTMRIFCPGGIL